MLGRLNWQLSVILATSMLLAFISEYSYAQEQSSAPNSSQESGPPQVLSDLLNKACSSDALEWIPEQNRLLVAGKINGKDAKFKIDTGALGTLLTLKSAKERKLPVIDFNATFTGIGGTGKVYGSPVQRLQLGGSVDLASQRLAVIDLPVLDGIDGLIGGDTLSSTSAIIDYRQHKLHIPMKTANFDPQKGATASGMLSTKLQREGNYVFATISIGETPIRLLVDTGAQRTVISSKAANRLKLQLKEVAEKAVGAGDKAISIQSARIEVFTFGMTDFRNIECVVMPLDYLTSYSKTEVDGILGADCLAASGAVLTIADSTIVLPPNEVVMPEPAADAKR